MYTICVQNSLQQKLVPMREKFKELEDKKAEELQKVKKDKKYKTINWCDVFIIVKNMY